MLDQQDCRELEFPVSRPQTDPRHPPSDKYALVVISSGKKKEQSFRLLTSKITQFFLTSGEIWGENPRK